MDLLLDTHVFLWWDCRDPQLAPTVQATIADPRNRVFVSAASVWEIAIKSSKGKLGYSGSPCAAIGKNGFQTLPMAADHAEEAGRLAWTHPDPFDRMLVAQARMQNLTLVHADRVIAEFHPVAQLWARG